MDLNKIKLLFTKPSYLKTLLELRKLRNTPRGGDMSTNLLGTSIRLADGKSFSFLFNEIFEEEIYKFRSESAQPYILDCGANIGISIFYFKKLYPACKIIAFEPDELIFKILESNVKSAGLENVTLYKKALWNEITELSFYSEGGDAGRVAIGSDTHSIITVPTLSLRKFIDREVDFIKLDIEGAELTVLKDIADLLHLVKNMFVEFHSFVDKPQQLSTLLAILENAGFRLHITSPGLKSHHPLMHRNIAYNMDMQLNIYAYR